LVDFALFVAVGTDELDHLREDSLSPENVGTLSERIFPRGHCVRRSCLDDGENAHQVGLASRREHHHESWDRTVEGEGVVGAPPHVNDQLGRLAREP